MPSERTCRTVALAVAVGQGDVHVRRAIEKSFGWLKDYGGWRKTRFRGLERVALDAHLSVAAYDLLRIARLMGEPSPG